MFWLVYWLVFVTIIPHSSHVENYSIWCTIIEHIHMWLTQDQIQYSSFLGEEKLKTWQSSCKLADRKIMIRTREQATSNTFLFLNYGIALKWSLWYVTVQYLLSRYTMDTATSEKKWCQKLCCFISHIVCCEKWERPLFSQWEKLKWEIKGSNPNGLVDTIRWLAGEARIANIT